MYGRIEAIEIVYVKDGNAVKTFYVINVKKLRERSNKAIDVKNQRCIFFAEQDAMLLRCLYSKKCKWIGFGWIEHLRMLLKQQ